MNAPKWKVVYWINGDSHEDDPRTMTVHGYNLEQSVRNFMTMDHSEKTVVHIEALRDWDNDGSNDD